MLLLLLSLPLLATAWPDGAPCVHAAYESMNPAEAVEHQGGLQLTVPPYEIEVAQRCYWRGQPITVTLQGKNQSVEFKGFVIQPFEFVNGRATNRRMGQLMRLDDNGSWQQQCFRFKDSATHSHDEDKQHITLWWKGDDDSRTVQFVATVVESQRRFWVRSVLSVPIPPCRVMRQYPHYDAPLPTMPPPVKPFKLETHRQFSVAPLHAVNQMGVFPNVQSSAVVDQMHSIQDDFARSAPLSAPRRPTPVAVPLTRQFPRGRPFRGLNRFSPRVKRAGEVHTVGLKMRRIIPMPDMITVHRRKAHRVDGTAGDENRVDSEVSELSLEEPFPSFAFEMMAEKNTKKECVDTAIGGRCAAWARFCDTQPFQHYMAVNCRRTCRIC